MFKHSLGSVDIAGLEPRASQVWRSVRLVPLVRTKTIHGLCLARVDERDSFTVTRLGAHTAKPDRELAFLSIVPHSFVVGWGDEAEAELNQGAAFVRESDGKWFHTRGCSVKMKLRMARRASTKALRFAPQQLAIEGLLSLFFAGPEVVTRDWSERLMRRGLDPRVERALSGRALPALSEALRVFEVLDGQCGMLLYFADELFGAFVAPTPEDYRRTHESMVLDVFPAELLDYARYEAPTFRAKIDAGSARTIRELRAALDREELAWKQWTMFTASQLCRSAMVQHVYAMDGFRLERFVTTLERKGEHHAGERVVARDGTVAYLKTYRLSVAQARRAYLLRRLTEAHWDLDDAASKTRMTRGQFIDELIRFDFGWMLGPKVLHELRGR
ncbi:MAG: hypothetical protein JNK05_35090 [Myxococcales bacterium]|nr:hypothetical protein [Myxococcales bacterium]